ncbi:tRNA(His) guanylyltransferase [Dirofilaria immitis]
MILTVSSTNSFIGLLCFLILSSSTIGNASIDALKSCFERYIGQRLSNLSPYHSEWRMKTPEECLLFCALSSSRCRSIVHDTLQHICYYFLNDGQNHTQVIRGMIYFRVTEKKCLDQFLNDSNLILPNSESAIPTTTLSPKKYERPAVVHANPLIHVPPGGRAITPTPYFNNQQQLKKHEKLNETNLTVLTSTMTASDSITIPINATTDNNSSSLTTISTTTAPIFSTIRSEKDEIYDESVELIPASEFSSLNYPALSSEREGNSTNSTTFRRSKALEQTIQSNHQTFPMNDASFFVGNVANLPQLDANFGKDRQKDGVDLNKLLKANQEDVRRSPIKTLMDDKILNKDINKMLTVLHADNTITDKLIPIPIPTVKSISITLSKKNDEMKKLSSPAICRSNEYEVWLVVENAILQIDKFQKKANAESYKLCKTKCNLITNSGSECISYTYDDVKRNCITYTSNDINVSSVAFLSSPETDFSIRTAIKFCYPENLAFFDECSEFIAFLDRDMDIRPREIFDDISKNYHGLHECIELCILAPYFHCKSARFFINLGKCLLYDENSSSKPEYFHEHQQHGSIYFENGCEQFDEKLISIPIKPSDNIRQKQQQQQQLSRIYYIEN